MRRCVAARLRLALLAVPLAIAGAAGAADPRQSGKRAGTEFLGPALKSQQADDGANPGMLWVEDGKALWRTPAGPSAKSCADCHGADMAGMRGVAARYPAVDSATGDLLNLEQRIERCRTRHQGAEPFGYETQPLLAMTALLAHRSRGAPISASIDGPARKYYEAGRSFFETRQGQLDLACGQCHDDNVGKKLRGDTISQGHPTGYPIYRLEWQTLGSLHRRLRACSLGVRAQVLPYGAPEYVALELFLADRARGLAIETPAVRR